MISPISRSYLEYEVLDENENIIDSNRAKGNSAPLYDALGWSTLNGSKDYGHYAFIAVVEYGANGNIVSTSFLSHETTNASQILNETAKENPTESYKYDFNLNKTFQNPKNKTYCFAMTKDSLKSFSNMYPGMFEEEYQHYSGSGGSDLLIVFLSLLAAVALAAFFLPYAKVLETGNEKIFRVPFEIVAVISCSVFGMSVSIRSKSQHLYQAGYLLCADKLQYSTQHCTWYAVYLGSDRMAGRICLMLLDCKLPSCYFHYGTHAVSERTCDSLPHLAMALPHSQTCV